MTLELRKVYFGADERALMERVLVDGLRFQQTAVGRAGGTSGGHWWYVLRIALALSLRLPDVPGEEYSTSTTTKAEPRLGQVIGTNPNGPDLSSVFQALISAHHGEDLFADEDRFVEVLQRHLRRGLSEIEAGWRVGNDFFDFVDQELFVSSLDSENRGPVDSDKLLQVLSDQGISGQLEKSTEGPRLTIMTLKLGSSGDLGRMKRAIDILPFELGQGHGATFEIAGGERRISLYLPRPQASWISPSAQDGLVAVQKSSGVLPVSPGVTADGSPLVFDLLIAPHLFIAGQTGSGKSVCVHAVIRSLTAATTRPVLALIDPKEVEFTRYKDSEDVKLFDNKVVTSNSDAIGLLEHLVAEMETRQSALAKLKVTNLADARERGSNIPYIIVIIEELADLVMANTESVDYLIRLSQKARAVGIHLVLATQRPDAETFPGLLRANIPSRIALAVRSASDSRIILDEPGAEKLLGRGDMLVKIAGMPLARVHGYKLG